MTTILSMKAAAEALGIPRRELRRRIHLGDVPAEKFDWIWIIKEEDLDKIREMDWYKKLISRTAPQ